MQETRVPERAQRTRRRSVAAEVSAVVCGLLSSGLLGWLGLILYDMAGTYGNITEGGLPSIAGMVALVAAGLGAAAVSLWTRDSRKALLAFVGVLVFGAVIFGVMLLIV